VNTNLYPRNGTGGSLIGNKLDWHQGYPESTPKDKYGNTGVNRPKNTKTIGKRITVHELHQSQMGIISCRNYKKLKMHPDEPYRRIIGKLTKLPEKTKSWTKWKKKTPL